MGPWKYIRMFDGKTAYTESDVDFQNRPPDFEMLFNLTEDPAELNNLIDAEPQQGMLTTLRAKCAAHSQSLNARRRSFKRAVAVKKR